MDRRAIQHGLPDPAGAPGPQAGGRAPAQGNPRAGLLLAGVLALILGALVFGLGGCGVDQSTVSSTVFAEQVASAEAEGPQAAQNAASFISLCANCHDRLDRELDWRKQRKLIFNHPAHFARGIRCAACHQEFPHKPGRIVHVPVETCFTCHGTTHGPQGILAPTGCDVCHTADIARITPDHEQATWVLQPGKGLARHARAALERRLYCKMCHEESFCRSCHRVDMPHPEDWVPAGHQEPAAKSGDACLKCHETKALCNDCHHAAFARLPDWTTQHKRVVLPRGAEPCFACHEPPYCSRCHVATGKKRGVHAG